MKLKDVFEILEAKSAWKAECLDCATREVTSCQASDLISDILSFRGPDSLLLTGLTNVHVIRAAELLDFVAICFVRGKQPQPEAVELAEEKGIPLLATPLLMYEACGRLYAAGLPAGIRKEGAADCLS